MTAAAAGGVLAAGATPVLADWPVAQHDLRRTGEATGDGNLTQPAVYWRRFMGGNIGAAGALPLDIDGDGAPEIAFVASGRLTVASPTGEVRWRSSNHDLTQLDAVADVTGDGVPELVAQSTRQAFAFDLTGALVWAEADGEMGTLGGVRVGDVDGDHVADVFVQECGCCQVKSDNTGFVYSLIDGVEQRTLTLPSVFCGGAFQMMIADLDGDADPDVTLGTNRTLSILDGATAAPIATTADLGDWTGASSCAAIDVDGVAPTELVCTLGLAFAPAGQGHRLYVLRATGSPAALQVIWSTNIGDRDAVMTFDGAARDLDGDGDLELVAGGTASDGRPVVRVVDAVTGAVLAGRDGEQLVGVVAGPTQPIVLTQRGAELVGSTLDAGTPALTERFALADRRALSTRDWDTAASQPLSGRIATFDTNGDGVGELLTVDLATRTKLVAYDLAAAGTPVAAQLGFGSEPLAAWGPIEGYLAVSTSDGVITLLHQLDGIGKLQIRTGGYFDNGAWLHLPQAPVVGALGDGPDRIVMSDSRSSVLALDASAATNLHPPDVLWTQPFTVGASIAPGLSNDGAAGLVCRRTDFSTSPATQQAAAIGADGAVRWQTAIGAGVQVFSDVVSGNFDGDAIPDPVVQWGNPTDADLQLSAYAGSDGHLLWTRTLPGPNNRIPAGASIADWNGDGRDDVVVQFWGLFVLSGVDGSTVASGGPPNSPYFLPTLRNLDGDPALEVSLSGGIDELRALDDSLQSAIWQSTEDDRPFPYAATTTCDGVPVLVSTSLAEPARMKVTTEAGATPGAVTTFVLAGGQLYADDAAAIADGASLSQLTSVQIHGDLAGDGAPLAVVGASDGYLYAVDPCAGSRAFALHFDGPVGAVAFGDTDGDGFDELIASVGDGFLYGIKNAPIAVPLSARDIPLGGSDADDDIDVVDTSDSLAVAWTAVSGATSYEVAVADRDGRYLTDPPWHDVGAVTTATLSGLPLADGERYQLGVRAKVAAGVSPDAVTDGVTVHAVAAGGDAGPTGDGGSIGGGDGGCCQTGAPVPAAPGGLVALALVLGARRRRQRR